MNAVLQSQVDAYSRILGDYDHILSQQNQELSQAREEILMLQNLLHEYKWSNIEFHKINQDLTHQLDLRDLAIANLQEQLQIQSSLNQDLRQKVSLLRRGYAA